MLSIKEVIVVEGRYDKAKLSSIVDAIIISTDGFSIFKDKEKLELLRNLAQTRGLLILTDSDAAGFKIRNFIGGAIDKKLIKHAYIPDIFGKEKRKATYSKEGKLGVEGVSKDALIKALDTAGVLSAEKKTDVNVNPVTKYHLYRDGFCGREDSASLRRKLLFTLGLPQRMSTNAFVKVLGEIMDYDEYTEIIKGINLKD